MRVPPPALVRLAGPLRAPLIFRVAPVSTPMLLSLLRVTAPAQAGGAVGARGGVPLRARRAPVLLRPEPLSVSGSLTVVRAGPCSCRAAPLLTVVPAVAAPRAVLLWMVTAPWLMAVRPL